MARRNLFDTGATVPLATGVARALGAGAAHQAQHLIGRGTKLDLDGRVVFITGAARGLGADIARQAHARGARVSLVGRTLAPLEKLADELGERAAAFEADVTDFDALQRAAAGTAQHFGGIDVVVANAGIAPPSDTILTIDPEQFERTVDVDLLGQWRTIRATLPFVIERQGHLLVIASIYAFFNGMLNASYAASKAGIEQMTRALRVELAGHGATAGVAYLGFVETDLARDVFAQAHIEDARAALPRWVSRPIPSVQAAEAMVKGIERRSAQVGAPGWVLPAVRMRGLLAALDEVFIHNPGVAAAVRRAELNAHAREHQTRSRASHQTRSHASSLTSAVSVS